MKNKKWEESWNNRHLIVNRVTKVGALNFLKKHQKYYVQKLKMGRHPKDGFVVYYDLPIEPMDALISFLNIDKESVKEWSDGSFTLDHKTDVEFILTKRPTEKYMATLGHHMGYYIHQN